MTKTESTATEANTNTLSARLDVTNTLLFLLLTDEASTTK